jgi:hypothetical protein
MVYNYKSMLDNTSEIYEITDTKRINLSRNIIALYRVLPLHEDMEHTCMP